MIRRFIKLWDSEPFGLHQVLYAAPDGEVRSLFWTYHPSFGWCDPETGDWDGSTPSTALRDAISRSAGRIVGVDELRDLARVSGLGLGEFFEKLVAREMFDI